MRRWLIRGGLVALMALAALFVAALVEAQRLDPTIRKHAIAYLEEHFNSDVEVGALHVQVPPLAPLRLLVGLGHGTLVKLDGDRIVLRLRGQNGLPPVLAVRHFAASLDLGSVFASPRIVHQVTLEGMEINVPPRGQRPRVERREHKKPSRILVQDVVIHDAVLNVLPRQSGKSPLHFALQNVHLLSAGKNVAMKYQAALVNAKPPGEIRSSGTFGPWVTDDPGATPLRGSYLFENADLGVFHGIAGILRSTGSFEGTLSAITARGEASVPDFRLKAAGNPIPLTTQFEVLVDGTNGDTELRPVNATLGTTRFTTTGAVIRHEGQRHRTVSITASMPSGRLRDVLGLAMKGTPIMEGTVRLNAQIVIPPLSGKVKEKLILDGSFDITRGHFLQAKIQDKIDELSRRGRGEPQNQNVDEVIDRMSGRYHLGGGDLRFATLAFSVPGAAVRLSGVFDLDTRKLDFHGVLMLQAKVSKTMKGWKHWLLKPADPFLANHGVGTYLHIKVGGTAEDPRFGLDPGGPR